MKTIIAVLIAAFLLAGCQTAAQRQAAQTSNVIRQATEQVKACVTEAYNAPEAAPVKAHRPQAISDATLEQLNSGAYVTDDEVKAIYALHDRVQACRKMNMEQLMTVVPTVVPIMADGYQQSDSLILALINKQTTWGQYLQTEQRIENDHRVKILAEWDRIKNQMQQSYQAEMQQRQQAAQAMSNYLQNQAAINALNKPTYTTCNTFGNTTNCLTH